MTPVAVLQLSHEVPDLLLGSATDNGHFYLDLIEKRNSL